MARVLLVSHGHPLQTGGASLRDEAIFRSVASSFVAKRVYVSRVGPKGDIDGASEFSEQGIFSDPYPNCFDEAAGRVFIDQVLDFSPDFIVFSTIKTHRYLQKAKLAGFTGIIFDMHNIEANVNQAFQSALSETPPHPFYQGYKLFASPEDVAAAERTAIEASDRVWVTTQADRDALFSKYAPSPSTRVSLIPNSVRVPSVVPYDSYSLQKLVFIGRLDYFPNLYAASFLIREVAPLLEAEGLHLPLIIAGAHPLDGLRELDFPPGVSLIADPHDVAPLLGNSVLVVPLLHGGGSRLKILEAFAGGVPVISSLKGIEGIDAVADQHFLLAESAADFIHQIKRLMWDKGLTETLRNSAHALALRKYSWEVTGQRVAEVLIS